MSKICVIPARGGSKGITGKNMKILQGIPLLTHTIRCAKDSMIFDEIIVSSDSEVVLREAEVNGVTGLKRSSQNSDDNIHAVHAVIETLQEVSSGSYNNTDTVYMLLPTSPLRIPSDIINVDSLILRNQNQNVISVKKVDHYLNNLRFLNDNKLEYIITNQSIRNLQRQEQRTLYVVNGSIFTSSINSLLEQKTFHQEKPIAYEMPLNRSVDINNLSDFAQAEYLLKEREK